MIFIIGESYTAMIIHVLNEDINITILGEIFYACDRAVLNSGLFTNGIYNDATYLPTSSHWFEILTVSS